VLFSTLWVAGSDRFSFWQLEDATEIIAKRAAVIKYFFINIEIVVD
jgi:hypothetical protein